MTKIPRPADIESDVAEFIEITAETNPKLTAKEFREEFRQANGRKPTLPENTYFLKLIKKISEQPAVTVTAQPSSLAGLDVYMSGFDYASSENDVKEFVERFGKYSKIFIPKNETQPNRIRGYIFVTYIDPASNQKAIAADKTEYRGRRMKINYAKTPTPEHAPAPTHALTPTHPPAPTEPAPTHTPAPTHAPARTPVPLPSLPKDTRKTLFVGNLSFAATETGMMKGLEAYNPVAVRIITESDGTSKGFGYVDFSTHRDAQTALTEMNGIEVDGRKLRITFDTRDTPNTDDEKEEEEKEIVSERDDEDVSKDKLFLRNLPPMADEAWLMRAFGKTYNAISAKVMRNKCIGFVTFASAADAEQAKKAYNGYDVQGYKLEMHFAREDTSSHTHRGRGQGRGRGGRGRSWSARK